MTRLTEMLGKHITSALAPLGFTKNGNTYRFSGINGDQAIINFQTFSALPPAIAFFVNTSVVPRTQVELFDFIFDRKRRSQPPESDGTYRKRIMPPREFSRHPHWNHPDELWTFREGIDGDVDRVGSRVATAVVDVAPTLIELLDRKKLLAFMQDPDITFPSMTGPRTAMILLIEDGPSPGLDAAIAEMVANGDEAGIAWAEQKLTRMANSGEGVGESV